jgi:hypothetical protein
MARKQLTKPNRNENECPKTDKGRATLAGTMGEYHFACPLDRMLFGFKEIQAEEVKKLLASGATDEQVLYWFSEHGTKKGADEIQARSAGVEAYRPYDDPEKKDWFAAECAHLSVRPDTTTLFDYLEADDAASFRA